MPALNLALIERLCCCDAGTMHAVRRCRHGAPQRDALAIVRARLYSELTPPGLHHQLVHIVYTAAQLPTALLLYLSAPNIDGMASFGGAGLGQKVIKPNPYVTAFSTALRQTYLFSGSSLSRPTSANSGFAVLSAALSRSIMTVWHAHLLRCPQLPASPSHCTPFLSN